MELELQTLSARLAAHRVLPRTDPLVRRALTDDGFRKALDERLAACGLELLEHPYAEHVSLRVPRRLEQPVFGAADAWLSNTLDLKRDQIALLVVLWALLILPKRQRQIERAESAEAARQGEMFGAEKPMPSVKDLDIHVTEAALLADFGDRLGGRTRVKNFGLPVLSRHGFIERRDGRITEGPLLDLVLDYTRMAPRILDGTLTDLLAPERRAAAEPPMIEDGTESGEEGEPDVPT